MKTNAETKMRTEEFNKFSVGRVNDVETFINDTKLSERLVKFWIMDENYNELNAECFYGYLKHWVNLGGGKWIVGIQDANTNKRRVEYYPLDRVVFSVEL